MVLQCDCALYEQKGKSSVQTLDGANTAEPAILSTRRAGIRCGVLLSWRLKMPPHN